MRWNGGASPKGREGQASGNVTIQEASDAPSDSLATPTTDATDHSMHNVIMGVDPRANGHSELKFQEMQERDNGSILASRPKSDTPSASAMDSMEMNQVIDDDDIANESEAVKEVAFPE